MLTSFFGKSKPINFILLALVIITGALVSMLMQNEGMLSASTIVSRVGFVFLLIFQMLLLDFIIKKNDLTKASNYAVLFFSFFFLFIIPTLGAYTLLLANLLILFSLRRTLSVSSEKNTEKKILDASLYITIASFFYFYSLLFFLVLFYRLFQKKNITYKHLLIPVAGFLGTFVLVTVYYFLTTDSFSWFYTWKEAISFNFSVYNSKQVLIAVTIVATLLLWTLFTRILRFKIISQKDKQRNALITLILIVSLAVTLASPFKNGTELLFTFAPLSIVLANDMEHRKEFWFNELLLWLVVLTPIVIFIVWL